MDFGTGEQLDRHGALARRVLRVDGNEGWQAYRVPPELKFLDISSKNLIALGFSGTAVRELTVFSRHHGVWSRHSLDAPATGEIVPEVGEDVAWYRVGNAVHAYSSTANSWDVLRLPDNGTGLVQMNLNTLMAQTDQTLYVFSAKLGKWSSGVQNRPIVRSLNIRQK
jgi:hypothetical protein